MDPVEAAQRLTAVGRYREALDALPSSSGPRDRVAFQILKAELFVTVGEPGHAHLMVETIEKSRNLTESDRSRCELVMSKVEEERGNFDSELRHLQKSLAHAERAQDLELECWAQFRLLALMTDRSAPESVAALMATFRVNVTRLGEPIVTAALHLLAAKSNGIRGLVANALHHTQLAQKLLESSPHLWLEVLARNNLTALSILRSEFEQNTLDGALNALALSFECGSVWAIRASLGNLGLLYSARGEFGVAADYFHQGVTRTSSTSEQVFALQENLALVYLAEGKLDQSLELLNRIDVSHRQPNDVTRYAHRHVLLTKAEVLARLQQWNDALSCAESVIRFAHRAGDEGQMAVASLFKAEPLLHLGRPAQAWQAISSVADSLPQYPPDLFARYERAVACFLAGTGDAAAGRPHRDRARRIYQGLSNAPALLELSRSWSSAKSIRSDVSARPQTSSASPATTLLQNVATLMLHAGRPELLATGLIAILTDLHHVTAAVAVARDDGGATEVLASVGTLAPDRETRTFTLGDSRNRNIDVSIQALPDMESQATVNSIAHLIGTLRDLELSQSEREERLTLWPVDELSTDDDDSVITGKMRKLMTHARRAAGAPVTVLITGESGTGKEILARAIHGYSARARKPFVPFNCTAVPRDLLESQMFGYRRGAFTGADRDYAGVIRSARDGTLFLDEVGELGLDLQPKLLRFLESGEINPLGDNAPFKVDVRIIAATNANLERMVDEGRFRDDLFYRLNVVCLTIPPLRERRDEIPALVHHFVAKALAEFEKRGIRVADETMERLTLFKWPGNVRQLQNELRRMVALADDDTVLKPSDLSRPIQQETRQAVRSTSGTEIAVPLNATLPATISRIEREMIRLALQSNQGRLDAAAKSLGISRKGLYLKRLRLGV